MLLHETQITLPVRKTYNDTSPPAFFVYDEPSVTFNGTTYPLANTKGRLSHTSAASGAPSGMTIYSYDAAGHVVDYWQCSYSNCTSPNPMQPFHYYYDLAGDISLWVSNLGYNVANTINTAQQIIQVASSFSDSTHPANLAQSITYTPFGAIEKLVNGCAPPGCVNRQEFYSYNNRLQPVMIQVGTSMACQTNQQTNAPCPNWTFNTTSNQISTAGFTYDAAGNLTADGTGVGTHTYQWDGEGRLKSVDGATATYYYNAHADRRVSDWPFSAQGFLTASNRNGS